MIFLNKREGKMKFKSSLSIVPFTLASFSQAENKGKVLISDNGRFVFGQINDSQLKSETESNIISFKAAGMR